MQFVQHTIFQMLTNLSCLLMQAGTAVSM